MIAEFSFLKRTSPFCQVDRFCDFAILLLLLLLLLSPLLLLDAVGYFIFMRICFTLRFLRFGCVLGLVGVCVVFVPFAV